MLNIITILPPLEICHYIRLKRPWAQLQVYTNVGKGLAGAPVQPWRETGLISANSCSGLAMAANERVRLTIKDVHAARGPEAWPVARQFGLARHGWKQARAGPRHVAGRA